MTSGRGFSAFKAGLIGSAALLAAGVAGITHAEGRNPLKIADAQYEPTLFTDIEGWAEDDHDAGLASFRNSCKTLLRSTASSREGQPMRTALYNVCVKAGGVDADKPGAARAFFENNFTPMRISPLGTADGFLTGYYEPIIEGSRVPTGEFTAPLYRRPPNLAIAGRRKLGEAFPSKGVKVGRRVGRRKLVPYYDRGQIEEGALDGWHLEICWLRSEVDVLFAQIQGSARIRLEDGSILRVNYDSHNGWPYTAVGRALIERKIFTKDELSMQRIRDWMTANPEAAKEVRRTNKSYVFFRITGLGPQDEAVGGQGVPLVPGRSIAVDHALHVYGTPFFISADLTIANEKTATKFRRLVFAQDTGSAIVGPARADIYFGAGAEAGNMAGRIKNSGRFVMLMPRELDPVEAGQNVHLPPERHGRFAQLRTGNMIDPTAEDVPLPAPRPAAAPAPAPPASLPKAKAAARSWRAR
jgi:membrane-bound lytic murein transglycosylase A